MKKDEAPVITEQDFNQPAAVVWSAISEVDKMRLWYFAEIQEFRAEPGFSTQFLTESTSDSFLHQWRVTEVDAPSKLAYQWNYRGLEGNSEVVFEISGAGNSSRLTVTHRVLESFISDLPEFSRESCVGGWTYFINERLKAYLDT